MLFAIYLNLKSNHFKETFLGREVTEEGCPISDVIHKGLDRPKFAADCLNVVMKELKLHCQDGTPGCKVIENLTLFWGGVTLS